MIRIADYITKAAWHSADKPSLTHEGRTFTWAETEERCWGFATALYDMGVRPGDRVAYLGLNSHRYYECYFVPSRIGAAVVTINYRLAIPEMIDCLNDCVPKVLIVDDLHLDIVFHALEGYEGLCIDQDGGFDWTRRQVAGVSKGQASAIQVHKSLHIAVEAARQHRRSLFVQQAGPQQRSQGIKIALLVCQNDLHDLLPFA